MTAPLGGDGFALRRATEADVDFLVELASHDEVSRSVAGAELVRVHAEVVRQL
jgi:hypothetical protein